MTDHITFSPFSKLPADEQVPHKAHFDALNETPILKGGEASIRQFQNEAEGRLVARWKAAPAPECKNCDGNGAYDYDTGNPNTFEENHECKECHGSGEAEKLSYEDWIETLDQCDPDLKDAGRF